MVKLVLYTIYSLDARMQEYRANIFIRKIAHTQNIQKTTIIPFVTRPI